MRPRPAAPPICSMSLTSPCLRGEEPLRPQKHTEPHRIPAVSPVSPLLGLQLAAGSLKLPAGSPRPLLPPLASAGLFPTRSWLPGFLRRLHDVAFARSRWRIPPRIPRMPPMGGRGSRRAASPSEALLPSLARNLSRILTQSRQAAKKTRRGRTENTE